MKKLTPWFSNEWDEINSINSTIDAIGLVEHDINSVHRKTGKLLELIRAQAKQIQELQVALNVLVQVVAERTQMSETEISNRIEAALAALAPTAPASVEQGGGGSYRTTPPSVPSEPLIACAACTVQTKRSQTFLTEDGSVCADCYEREYANR